MTIELGRIGGQMLKEDLVRHGTDLAFETNLLYLNVNDKRIGINTDSLEYDLEVPNGFDTTDLIVDDSQTVGNIILNADGSIRTVYGPININLTGPSSYFSFPALSTESLRFQGNTISATNTNANIDLMPHGTGQTEIYSNLYTEGNIRATGNITLDGNIVLGSNDLDSVAFNADVVNSLLPKTNNLSLGTDTKRWSTIETELTHGTLITTNTLTVAGVDLANRQLHIKYVSVNGNDTNSGTHQNDPFLTVAKALSVAQDGDTIYIYPGTYAEVLPLTVPVGVTVKGAGIRAVKITPASGYEDNDVFLLNGETTIEDLTVASFQYNAVNNTGYAFRFATNFKVESRSPYIRNISVITSGSVTGPTDPRGFNSGDAGRGALVDGSVANSASVQATMLFHAVTFITPGVDCITMTNGVRVEWLNSFIYYANRGLYATNGSLGFANLGTKFGAEVRAIASANVYGNYGAVADGASTLMYLVSHNFSYIGTGNDDSNDTDNLIQANETVELNSGKIRYVSQDQGGNLRVGDTFNIDFDTGTTSISTGDLGVLGLSSIKFVSDGNVTYIDAGRIDTGNIRLSGNTVNTIAGELNLTSVTGLTNILNDTFINGDLGVTGNTAIHGTLTVGNQIVDSVNIAAKIASNLIPASSGLYNFGSDSLQWNDIYLSSLKLDNIDITGNQIKTTTSNSDLELIAHGTGIISILDSDTTLLQNLTVDQHSYLKAVDIDGTTNTTGNNIITGNTSLTGDKTLYGNITVTNKADLANLEFNTNFVTSVPVDSNLLLKANGTGIVRIPNSVNVTGNVTISGIPTFSGVTSSSNTTASALTNSAIRLQDNFITTISGNSDLLLKANGTGTVVLPTNNLTVTKDVTVDGSSNLESTDVQGQLTVTGAVTKTGDIDQTGSTSVSGELTAYSPVTIGNVTFNTNFVSTTSGDLSLIAHGTGKVLIPTNDVTVQNIKMSGDTSFATVTILAGIGGNKLTNTTLDLLDNFITTTSGNTDLILQAHSTGELKSVSNDWLIDNNLTVSQAFYTGGLTVVGDIDITGSTTQTGNILQTGSVDISGNLTAIGVAQLGNVQFNTNFIDTATGELTLIANGTGKVILPSNNVQVKNIKADSVALASLSVSAGVIFATLTNSTTSIAGNTITTVTPNTNLLLEAHGTGTIHAVGSNVQLDQNLTVNGTSTLSNTVIGKTITTNGVQNVAGSDGPVGLFFLNGWPSHPSEGLQYVQPGWTVVGHPTWVVTVVGDGVTDETITITGGVFVSGQAYAFTGSMPADVTLNGNYIQTGNRTQTGNLTVYGTVSVTAPAQFEDIQFNTNFLTTTQSNSNIELRAHGTGKVLVPTNTLLVNNDLTVSGLSTFKTTNTATSFTSPLFTNGNIQVQDNTISTTTSNSNLEFYGASSGGVLLQDIFVSSNNEIKTLEGNKNITFAPYSGKNLVINKTNALRVARGTTSNMPVMSQADVRFNTDVTYFEGHSTAKRTFSGLFSDNRHTYVIPESTKSQADGILTFVANNISTMRVGNGKLSLNGLQISEELLFNSNVISTTESNANINLVPSGSGVVKLSSKINLIGDTLTNTASTITPITLSSTGAGYVQFDGSGGLVIPVGNDASRSYVEIGDTRWNTQQQTIEIYDGSNYVSAGGVGGITEAYMEDLSNIYSIILG